MGGGRLGFRMIEQNMFLEIILAYDLALLRRPVIPREQSPELPPRGFITATRAFTD